MANRNPEGVSGHFYEAEVLGSGVAQTKWLARAKELGMNERGYLPYNKAIALAREFQPGDPTNPSTDFANDLRLAIIERLEKRGFLEAGHEDAVKYFLAAGMPLDVFHGVDAFIEFYKNKQVFRVTLDETTNRKKIVEGHKANIIFEPVPDAVQDTDAYLARIDELAEDATAFLERDIVRSDELRAAAA